MVLPEALPSKNMGAGAVRATLALTVSCGSRRPQPLSRKVDQAPPAQRTAGDLDLAILRQNTNRLPVLQQNFLDGTVLYDMNSPGDQGPGNCLDSERGFGATVVGGK